MLAGVDFKAAGHGVQLLGIRYQQDSPAVSGRQLAGTVPDPAAGAAGLNPGPP